MNAKATKPATVLHRLGGIEAGPAVVFIHGFAADRYAWAANAPALFPTHATYAVDLPGHGAAGSLGSSANSLRMIARDVLNALEGELPSGFALVGHSLGGAVALEMGKIAPDRVLHVAAIAPAGLGRHLDREFLARVPELHSVDDAKALLETLAARPRLIGVQMAQHLLKSLDGPRRRDDLRALGAMLANLERYCLPDIETTWIWGALDTINPLDADAMDSSVVSINVIPDAGHLPQIESALKVNRIIARALAKR